MNNDISCVEKITKEMNIDYNYLFIQKTGMSKLFCVPRGDTYRGGNLIQSLRTSEYNYINVYESDSVEIFAIQK